MDRLKSLEVLVAIADLGSFRRAAARLQMSPAMVTTHINRLEERLGVRLIARSTRRLALTEQGRAFVADARGVLEMLRAAEDGARGGSRLPSGRIRIDAPASIGMLFLVPAIERLRTAYPDIVIDLTLGDRGTIHRAEGFDVIIRVGAPPVTDQVAVTVGRSRFVLVAAPSYVARRGRPQALTELRDHACILYSTVDLPGGSAWRFMREGQLIRMPVPAAATFNNGSAITEAAIRGVGIAQNLDVLVKAPLDDGRLVPILDDHCGVRVPVVIEVPRDRYQLPAVRMTVDFLVEEVAWGLDPAG